MSGPSIHTGVLAFATGLWLALLQFGHFFLLEVRLASTAATFFVALFCWLVGFLAGLQADGRRAFAPLVLGGATAYYVAYAVLATWPYQDHAFLAAAGCVAVGGAAAGSFFRLVEDGHGQIGGLLFHENNGFVLGVGLALVGAIFEGRWLLAFAPALGAALVLGLVAATRSARGSAGA